MSSNAATVPDTIEKRVKFTIKEARFCLEVVEGKSYTKAYLAAGYAPQPLSRTAIRMKASRLAMKPHIAARIAELQAQLVERCLMTKREWLERMDRMARADVRSMFNPQGDLKPVNDIGDEEAELIEGLEVVEQFTKVGEHAEHTGYVKKLKLTPKRQVYKDIGEARGWIEQDTDVPQQKTLILRKWVREEHHVHITVTDERAGSESGGTILDVGGQSDGHDPAAGGRAEGDVPAVGATGVRAAGVESAEHVPDAGDRINVPAEPEPASPVQRRVVRRKILPDLREPGESGTDGV